MNTRATTSRSRLTPTAREQLKPWRRAERFGACHLYWLPVEFPATAQHRQWLLTFLDALSEVAERTLGLQPHVFLQLKVLYPNLLNAMVTTASEFNPLIGLGRRPRAPLPPLPDQNYVEDLQTGRKAFTFGDNAPDYCYWMVGRQTQAQRRTFLGFGGMTMLFIKPDPHTVPPTLPPVPPGIQRSPMFASILEQWNPTDGLQMAYAMKSKFLAQSKELFGMGLENDPQYPGLQFILPLLTTNDFFDNAGREVERWFEMFDIYVQESVHDRGVLLATKQDCEQHFLAILETMKQSGMSYNERVEYDREV